MTISVRLDPETEAMLRRRLASEGASLSKFVRDAIREKLEHAEEQLTTPYAVGKSLFGRYASGESDRSTRRKELLRERIRVKHRH